MSDTLDPYIGATDEEVAEIEALASSRTVLHWATLLRLIHRMRNAEASADYAWQRADTYDKRAQSFEPDLMKAHAENDRLREALTEAREDSEKYAREWSVEHTRALTAEAERDRLRAERDELHRTIIGGEPDPRIPADNYLEMVRTLRAVNERLRLSTASPEDQIGQSVSWSAREP